MVSSRPIWMLWRDLAELDLHALAVGELDAEALAPVDVLLRDLHAALGPAESSACSA